MRRSLLIAIAGLTFASSSSAQLPLPLEEKPPPEPERSVELVAPQPDLAFRVTGRDRGEAQARLEGRLVGFPKLNPGQAGPMILFEADPHPFDDRWIYAGSGYGDEEGAFSTSAPAFVNTRFRAGAEPRGQPRLVSNVVETFVRPVLRMRRVLRLGKRRVVLRVEAVGPALTGTSPDIEPVTGRPETAFFYAQVSGRRAVRIASGALRPKRLGAFAASVTIRRTRLVRDAFSFVACVKGPPINGMGRPFADEECGGPTLALGVPRPGGTLQP